MKHYWLPVSCLLAHKVEKDLELRPIIFAQENKRKLAIETRGAPTPNNAL
jgi:hypothetical protein